MSLKTLAMRTHEELRADYKKLSDAVMDIQEAIPQKQRNDRYIDIYKALIRSTIKGHEENADILYEHIEFAALILNGAGKNPYTEDEKSILTAVLKKTFSQLNPVVQKKLFTALHSVEDLTHFIEAGLKGDTILPASVQKAMQKFWEDYTELDYDMLFANDEVTLDRTHSAFEGTEKDSLRRIAHIAEVMEGALEKKPNLYDFHDQHGRREITDLLALSIKAVLIGARENADVINDCSIIVHFLRPASGQYTVATNYLDYATLSAKQINPVFNALSDDQLETLLKSLFKYGHLSPALYRGILERETESIRFTPLDWQTGIPDESKAVDLIAPEDVYPFLSQRKNPQLPDRVWKIAEKILFGLEPLPKPEDSLLNTLPAWLKEAREKILAYDKVGRSVEAVAETVRTIIRGYKEGEQAIADECKNLCVTVTVQPEHPDYESCKSIYRSAFRSFNKFHLNQLFDALREHKQLTRFMYLGTFITSPDERTAFAPFNFISNRYEVQIKEAGMFQGAAPGSYAKTDLIPDDELTAYRNLALPKNVRDAYKIWAEKEANQKHGGIKSNRDRENLVFDVINNAPEIIDFSSEGPAQVSSDPKMDFFTMRDFLVACELRHKGYNPEEFQIDITEDEKWILADADFKAYSHPVTGEQIPVTLIYDDQKLTGLEPLDLPNKKPSLTLSWPQKWDESYELARPATPDNIRPATGPSSDWLKGNFNCTAPLFIIPTLFDNIDIIPVEDLLPDGKIRSHGIRSSKPREFSDELGLPQPRPFWILKALDKDGFKHVKIYHNESLDASLKDHTHLVIHAKNDRHSFQIAVCVQRGEDFEQLLATRQWEKLVSSIGHSTYIIRGSIDLETEKLKIADLKERDDVWTAVCIKEEQYVTRIRRCAYTPLEDLPIQLKRQMGWGGPTIAMEVLQTLRVHHQAKDEKYTTTSEAAIEHGPLAEMTTPRRLFDALHKNVIEGLEHIKTKAALYDAALNNPDLPEWVPGTRAELAPVVDLTQAFEKALLHILTEETIPSDPALTEALENNNVVGREDMDISPDVKLDKDFYVATSLLKDNYEINTAAVRQFARILGLQ